MIVKRGARPPEFFCLVMDEDGGPVWTDNPKYGQKFKKDGYARAVIDEWCLDAKTIAIESE